MTLALLLSLPLAAGARAQTGEDSVVELRREIQALRQEYEARLRVLETRLAVLEAEGGVAPPKTAPGPAAEPRDQPPGEPEDELAALRAAARAAAGTGTGAEAPTVQLPTGPPTTPPVGRERNLNRLNPEISFTGDLLSLASDRGREELEAREFELSFQAALDPFSSTKWFLAFSPEEGVEIEEGYITYSRLPGGTELRAGKLRQSFGVLNRWHLHALPQVDYPLALTTYFDPEGLSQTGISLSWLLPHPWAGSNEVTLQVTDGESRAFGGESFQRLAVLGRLNNYWDLGAATYLDWGLSGIAGETATGGTSRVWGSDFTLHWQPPARAKYREVTWRTELLLSQRDDEADRRREALGLYSYLEGLVAQNLYLGMRYDRVEDPLQPEATTEGFFPYMSWWQSEYVRLRAEYGYLEDDLAGDSESRFTLQLTWAAGPHKHELY